jgi:hypothetical protein
MWVLVMALKPQVLYNIGYKLEQINLSSSNGGMMYNVKFDDNSVLGLLHYVVVGDVACVL